MRGRGKKFEIKFIGVYFKGFLVKKKKMGWGGGGSWVFFLLLSYYNIVIAVDFKSP